MYRNGWLALAVVSTGCRVLSAGSDVPSKPSPTPIAIEYLFDGIAYDRESGQRIGALTIQACRWFSEHPLALPARIGDPIETTLVSGMNHGSVVTHDVPNAVLVSAPGYAQQLVRTRANSDRQNELSFQCKLSTGYAVRGRITDESTHLPLPGVRVSIHSDSRPITVDATDLVRNMARFALDPWEQGSVVTDAKGSFTIPNVPSGTARLRIRHHNYRPEYPRVTIGEEERASASLTIELKLGSRLRGRVTREIDGTPATGRLVFLKSAWAPLRDRPPLSDWCVVDASGEYTLGGLPAGEYYIRVLQHGEVKPPIDDWGVFKISIGNKETVVKDFDVN